MPCCKIVMHARRCIKENCCRRFVQVIKLRCLGLLSQDAHGVTTTFERFERLRKSDFQPGPFANIVVGVVTLDHKNIRFIFEEPADCVFTQFPEARTESLSLVA